MNWLAFVLCLVLAGPVFADDGPYVINAQTNKLDRVRQVKTTAEDAASSTTSSASGLEIVDDNLITLLQGCSDGNTLKWTESTDLWSCANDVILSGTGPDLRWSPTSGDVIHAGAEYATNTGTIWFLSNVTDSKFYILFDNQHRLYFPQLTNCASLRTDGQGRVLCQ